MSFPDDFVLPDDQPMTSIARQIGNAVPPVLAARIADALAAALDSGQLCRSVRSNQPLRRTDLAQVAEVLGLDIAHGGKYTYHHE